MASLKHYSTLALISLAASLSCNAAHYKIFVLTGESNALGMTGAGENDVTPGSDPADQHVQFYWDNIETEATSIGDSAGAFSTLQSQQGGSYSGSTTHWGPEINFARTLYRAGVRDFAIIKASRGNAGGNSLWSKGSADDHMYDHVVDTVTAATTELTNNGHTFEISGLLYQQGESDSAAEATLAGSRVKDLVDNLRVDLPSASSLHGLIGGITAEGADRDTVRMQQTATANSTSYLDFISNTDLDSSLYNGINLNKYGKNTIGERFALSALSAELVDHHYGNLTFIGDSITQGGNGDHPSYRYTVFQHLANNSVPINSSTGYKFTGSVTGPYNNSSLTTPNVNGQSFENVHDGHYGWRAFWINGRVALPSGRRSLNRGEGTILNWTNQASPQEYDLNSLGNKVSYPDLTTSGTGNTGTTYIPDTVVMLIGINDLGDAPHDAAQANADISMLIDQLRAANPNVRIHLNLVLPTSRNLSWESTKIDELNGYLVTLAATKNASSSTSPVWIIDAATDFIPSTMTYDNIHPNSVGEAFVGDRVAASLGLTETPAPSIAPEPPHTEADSGSFSHQFEGNDIFGGSSYINGWSEQKGTDTTESLVTDGTNLRHTHTNGSDSWLEATGAGWADVYAGSWTWEARLKFHSNPAGYFLWMSTGSNRIYIEIHGDRTQDYQTSNNVNFNVAHDNLDGDFHTYRVVNDAGLGKYHVFRDGVRLTPVNGATYDSSSADGKLFMGDYTSGSFGDNYDVEIDYVRYDQGGLYLPAGTDSDGDNLPDSWEYTYFGDFTSTSASADSDADGQTNLQEYLAATTPTDRSSLLEVSSINKSGTTTSVNIISSALRNYSLYRSSDLGVTEAWTLVDGPTTGNGTTLQLQGSSTNTADFYRVEASLP